MMTPGEQYEAWLRGVRRADIDHHLDAMEAYQDRAEMLLDDVRASSIPDLVWCRDRIEGHAARAIAAFLLWGLSR